MFLLIILFLYFELNEANIYSLNESEYSLMPALYSLDDYDYCMSYDHAIYCLADYDPFSTTKSALMEKIKEYSAQSKKHFNHTKIHKGICITQTCKDFLHHNLNRTVDLNATLEACVNETIWRQYGIQAKLAKVIDCNRSEDKNLVTYSDITVLVVYFVIILLNVLGTAYDVVISKQDTESGNKYLMAFSLFASWKKLVAPSGKGPDERLARLKAIHGLRVMTMFLVIFAHGGLMVLVTYIENPLFFEKLTDDPAVYLVLNGHVVTANFFVMSSFLLVYNLLIYAEKHELTWFDFPKGVLLRWIRLTPVYVVVLIGIATFMRHLGNGPLWRPIVVDESDACRDKWWFNILYINNYMYSDSNCLPQTWYLAADFQLFTVLFLLCTVVRSPRGRKIMVFILFVLSLSIIAFVTLYKHLDGTLLQTPEFYRVVHANNETFKQMYIPGHTNLLAYAFGFAAALLTYQWQNEDKDLSKYRNYRWAFWLMLPAGIVVIISGGVFYIDEYEPSQLVKTLYAVFYRLIIQGFFTICMVGCFFKFECLYRSILEWRGFTWMSRVSYCAFLVHTVFQRYFMGVQRKPVYFTKYYVLVVIGLSSICITYMVGALLFLLVEAPVAALVKTVMTPSNENKSQKEDNK